MINIVQKENCCGCSACMQVCPKKCITMKADSEGFDYPVVDINKCVNCKLCEKVCPIINTKSKDESILESYIAYTTDNSIREQSSSGGIFSICANKILDNAGVVYGAAYDDEFLVHHIGIEDKRNLAKLQGSKYLQSRIENIYVSIKENLVNNKKILFVGTACQVSGLKSYLGKDYENLYTIDVLCHGVPSPKVWKKYLDEIKAKNNTSISNISFRDKSLSWRRFSLKIDFADGNSFKESRKINIYMKLFLSNICLRPACHNCKFKTLNRDSDMTIGDAWGVEKHSPEMDDNRGASVIIIHNEKGKEMFNDMSKMLVYKAVDIDIALPKTSDSRKSVKPQENRRKFFKRLDDNHPCDELVKLCEPSLKGRIRDFLGRVKRKILK